RLRLHQLRRRLPAAAEQDEADPGSAPAAGAGWQHRLALDQRRSRAGHTGKAARLCAGLRGAESDVALPDRPAERGRADGRAGLPHGDGEIAGAGARPASRGLRHHARRALRAGRRERPDPRLLRRRRPRRDPARRAPAHAGRTRMTLVDALPTVNRSYAAHRRIAVWTFPVWAYVSVTGVLVYWMLYRL